MIVYCQITSPEKFGGTTMSINKIRPHVDRVVIIFDAPIPEKISDWLKEKNCEGYYHEWEDSLATQRNHYLEKLNDGDWCIVSDSDEYFDLIFCKDVRKICSRGDKENIAVFLINSHNIIYNDINGEIYNHENRKSNFYKNLIFKYYKGMNYLYTPHEILMLSPSSQKITQLDDKYYYEYVRKMSDICRNSLNTLISLTRMKLKCSKNSDKSFPLLE